MKNVKIMKTMKKKNKKKKTKNKKKKIDFSMDKDT